MPQQTSPKRISPKTLVPEKGSDIWEVCFAANDEKSLPFSELNTSPKHTNQAAYCTCVRGNKHLVLSWAKTLRNKEESPTPGSLPEVYIFPRLPSHSESLFSFWECWGINWALSHCHAHPYRKGMEMQALSRETELFPDHSQNEAYTPHDKLPFSWPSKFLNLKKLTRAGRADLESWHLRHNPDPEGG